MEVRNTDILVVGENINSLYLCRILKNLGRDILLLSQNRAAMLTNPVFKYYEDNAERYKVLNDSISKYLTELGIYHKPSFSPISVVNPFGEISEFTAISKTHNFYEYSTKSGSTLHFFIFENVENCLDVPESNIFKFEKLRLRVLDPNRMYSPYEVAKILDEDSEAVLSIAKNIKQNLKSNNSIAVLPPILGIETTDRIIQKIRENIDTEVFESIPLNPAVQSRRFYNTLDREFEKEGINRIYSRILQLEQNGSKITSIITERYEIRPRIVVLMTERFVEEGLTIRDNTVVEPIFNLPVFFDNNKNELPYFTEEDILADHNIYSCGIRIDESFSPLDIFNNTIFENLKCCGSIIKGNRDNLLTLYNTHRLSEILRDGGNRR